MMLFLKIVAGFFIAFVLLLVVGFFFIRWKFRRWIDKFADALKEAAAGGVPPFRIHLRKRERDEEEDEDDWLDDENIEAFEARSAEFESLGFTKLEDYHVDEIMTQMRVFVDEKTCTYGIVYSHPLIKVWCDVVRKYEDGTGWTFGTTKYHGMDIHPKSTHRFFPDESLTEVVTKFKEEAPREDAILATKEDFPALFEKAYAEEMDWRISRNGPTEEEIRRIAQMNDDECTDEQVQQIQTQWRMAISEFQKERVLKRYRKSAELNSFQWDHLQNYGVVVHDKMRAEELLEIFDEEYYPTSPGESDDEDLDEEELEMRAEWEKRLRELRAALQQGPPQQVFRNLVEIGNGESTDQWEFLSSVTEPIAADIWIRTYGDEDSDAWDDDE